MNGFPAQSVVEYGLIVTIVAILILITANVFGSAIMWWFQEIASRITTVMALNVVL